MDERFIRTSMLIGEKAIDKLKNSHIAVFGLGGVGSYVAEALARSGLGKLTVIDNDTVNLSNINRQLNALTSTVGMLKTEVIKNRLLDINPKIEIVAKDIFLDESNINEFELSTFDYVVDAIDSVKSKVALIEACFYQDIKIISAMGAGNKLEPQMLEVEDIFKTSICPLARAIRPELKKRGVLSLKTVYSKEPPVTNARPPGSISFVPSVMGLIIAGEVIKDIIKN